MCALRPPALAGGAAGVSQRGARRSAHARPEVIAASASGRERGSADETDGGNGSGAGGGADEARSSEAGANGDDEKTNGTAQGWRRWRRSQ